jgi:outer membrane protein OmpA-like peptidoglycan-associated protein
MASAVTAYTYTAKAGDTLKSIAKEYYGDEQAVPALKAYNNTPDSGEPPEGAQISLPSILVWPKEQTDEDNVSVLVNTVYKRIKGFAAVFYEIEDIHFHHNSVVPCLSTDGKLLNTIADALGYIEAHPEAEVAIAGHASSAGDAEYNKKLSLDRAKAIRALLDDDEKTFTDLATSRSFGEDLYAILESLTDFYKWNCDPGAKTNAANASLLKPTLLAFQKEYNQKIEDTIDEDGVFGKQTWGAIFKTYQYYIAEFCKQDKTNLSVVRLKINYEKKSNGIIGCGEDTPMENAGKEKYKSTTNRRAEILFLDPVNKPQEKAVLDKKETDAKPIEKTTREIKGNANVLPWIDTHMHVMSGYCMPLPLLWNQMKSKTQIGMEPSWKDVTRPSDQTETEPAILQNQKAEGPIIGMLKAAKNAADKVVGNAKSKLLGGLMADNLRGMYHLGILSTEKIGETAIRQAQMGFDKVPIASKNSESKPIADGFLLNTHPMNMDYAHYRGYGIDNNLPGPAGDVRNFRRIYEVFDGKLCYWNEKTGKWKDIDDKDPEVPKKVLIGEKNTGLIEYKRNYQNYASQLKSIQATIQKSKGALLSFYHLDPRKELDSFESMGSEDGITWSLEVKNIEKQILQRNNSKIGKKELISIGAKMYTALGYKPYINPKTVTQPSLVALYKGLAEIYSGFSLKKGEYRLQVPIVCHCSYGPQFTHDMEIIYDRDKKNGLAGIIQYENAKEYFWQEYVSPHAWDKVMSNNRELRLCLAHFGGSKQFWTPDAHYKHSDWMFLSKAILKQNSVKARFHGENLSNHTDPKNWVAKLIQMVGEYDNFFVDISFFATLGNDRLELLKEAINFQPLLKERILWGTDWYMVCQDPAAYNYSYMLKTAQEGLKQLGEDVLFRFIAYNPMKFLQMKQLLPLLEKVPYYAPYTGKIREIVEKISGEAIQYGIK